MTRHTCSNCGAIFEDDQFCPECGQWVDPAAGEEFEEFELSEPPDDYDSETIRAIPYVTVNCPSCGVANPETNRHCEECGARLSQGELPVAPQPLVQTTAGIRAAMVIGTVLLAVVVIAALVNLFGGGDGPDTATPVSSAPTTSAVARAEETVRVASVMCSSQLDAFPCENLIDNTDAPWNDASLGGQGASITFTFERPYTVTRILIVNLGDDVRFKRNYRIESIQIGSNDLGTAFMTAQVLDDNSKPQIIDVATIETTQLTITVTSVYPAEIVDDTRFDELVVQEITIFGVPAG